LGQVNIKIFNLKLNAMSILSQIASEISSYAKDFIKIEISPLSLSQSSGSVWNPGDTGTFSIKVTNSGHMDVINFKIHVNSYFGKVKFAFPIPGVSTAYTNSLVPTIKYKIPAHSSINIIQFVYKAEKKTEGAQTVLTAHVEAYDLNWDHILNDHTWYTTLPADSLEIVIHPV
jgi:hypothetical protein